MSFEEREYIPAWLRRLVLGGFIIAAFFLAYYAVKALLHWLGGIQLNLPDLSNHDFEWLVLAFLLVISMSGGRSCKCKCK